MRVLERGEINQPDPAFSAACLIPRFPTHLLTLVACSQIFLPIFNSFALILPSASPRRHHRPFVSMPVVAETEATLCI
jgi:hypothetical protein